MSANARTHLLTALLFLLVWISSAWFLQDPQNPNIVSRMALAIGLATEGTAAIDPFQALTIDKALLDGHYYSDKAPGMAFMATPIVAAASHLLAALGRPLVLIEGGELTWHYQWLTFLCTLLTSGLLTALAAAALFRMALGQGAAAGGAAAAALAYALATPVLGWSSAFFGHAAAAALLFLAFALVREMTAAARPGGGRAVLAGALLAWAVVVEFPAAPAAAMIAVYGLWRASRWGAAGVGRVLLAATVGGFAAGLPLFVYNTVTFGGPLSLGYQHVVGFEGMQQGFLGLTLPKPAVVAEILFLPYRGILWLAPVLLLVPWGLARMARRRRAEALLVAAVTVYFLAFNAAYHYWDGGWLTGPRHITPAVPFLALSLAGLWRGGAATMPTRALLLALIAVGTALSVICASTTMMVSVEYTFPLADSLWPRFRDGFIGFSPGVAALLPLTGWAALVPLAGLWLVGGALMWRLAPVQAGAGTPSARQRDSNGGIGMAQGEVATLAGGCFWCLEAVYLDLKGIAGVVSGYMGGDTENPDYQSVCGGRTGHAEVVQVTFDPAVISYAQILDVFFVIHDPTQLNRQGNDVGTQYRSAIFTHSDAQKAEAEAALARAAKLWDGRVVTEVTEAVKFWPAEDYHQDYYAQNPNQPYCMFVVAPKVIKARSEFTALLKSD